MTEDNKLTKEQSLKIAIAMLDKEFGKGTIVSLEGHEMGPWPSVSTGVLSLDLSLGIGGLPKGRIVEIYGPEGIGKSTLSCSVIAEAQKSGGRCAFIDVEHALDPVYAKNLGVDLSPEKLVFSQPNSGEEALEIADVLTKTGSISVIVIDSVASLIPLAELNGTMEDQQMGALPRLMGKAMRKLEIAAAKSGTLILFTNQVRKNLGAYGSPDVTPGGNALKFAASVRIKLSKKAGDKKEIKDISGNVIGIGIEAYIIKNKMNSPYKKCEFDIIFGRGVDNLGCIIDISASRGYLNKSGAWYKWPDGEIFAQGRTNAIEKLANDLDIADKLKELIINEGL